MKDYKHLFFDLDHTLWDFETNSRETLQELYEQHNLGSLGVTSFKHFHETYLPINDKFWYMFHNGKVTKEQLRQGRFRATLSRFAIEDEALIESLAHGYLSTSPNKASLLPGAIEVLEYLDKKYALHIITNGFSEVQHIKINNSGLKPFFKNIIVSDEIGMKKPQPEIFMHALQLSGGEQSNTAMIGDSLFTDIEGARNVGIDTIYFNPKRNWHKAHVTYEIQSLQQLRDIL